MEWKNTYLMQYNSNKGKKDCNRVAYTVATCQQYKKLLLMTRGKVFLEEGNQIKHLDEDLTHLNLAFGRSYTSQTAKTYLFRHFSTLKISVIKETLHRL